MPARYFLFLICNSSWVPCVCEGSGVHLLCSPGRCWKDRGQRSSPPVHSAICKVPERSFPIGSQDDERQTRAVKDCTNLVGLTHRMDRNTRARSTLQRAFCQPGPLCEGLCVLCATRWPAGEVMPTSQVWTQGQRAEAWLTLPRACYFSWTSADDRAPHLHGLTVSLLPTHPVGKSSQDPLPSLVPCPFPSHHRACSSHAGPWGWQASCLFRGVRGMSSSRGQHWGSGPDAKEIATGQPGEG